MGGSLSDRTKPAFDKINTFSELTSCFRYYVIQLMNAGLLIVERNLYNVL